MGGYVSEYKNEVPVNCKGFSPGFMPSIAYRFTNGIHGQRDLLGSLALMFTVVFPISKDGFCYDASPAATRVARTTGRCTIDGAISTVDPAPQA